MSKDKKDTEYVGMRLPRQMLDRMDEIMARTGINRQEQVKNALKNELF